MKAVLSVGIPELRLFGFELAAVVRGFGMAWPGLCLIVQMFVQVGRMR